MYSFSKAPTVFGASLRTVGLANRCIFIRDFSGAEEFSTELELYLLTVLETIPAPLHVIMVMYSFHQLFDSLCRHYHHLIVQDCNLQQ